MKKCAYIENPDYLGIANDFIAWMDRKIPRYSKQKDKTMRRSNRNDCTIKDSSWRKVSLTVDGIKIEGSVQKVKDTLEKLNYPYYESQSKGIILIENMDSEHIRNSILKISKGLLELMRYEDIEKFTERIKFNGLKGDDNKCLGWLCSELVKRHGLNQLDEPYQEEMEDSYNDYGGDF